jgi:hypothetical protein
MQMRHSQAYQDLLAFTGDPWKHAGHWHRDGNDDWRVSWIGLMVDGYKEDFALKSVNCGPNGDSTDDDWDSNYPDQSPSPSADSVSCQVTFPSSVRIPIDLPDGSPH